MKEFINVLFSATFLYSVLRVSTPLVLASIGGLVADLAGSVNIALEGIMVGGAFAAVLVSAWSRNPVLGILAATVMGIILSAILALFHLHLKADIIITAIGINILATGGTAFVMYVITGQKGYSSGIPAVALPNISIPLLKSIPILKSLSGHSIVTYLALLSGLGSYLFLYRTKLGLWIRAVGSNPEAGAASGISVIRVRWLGILISGALAGLGGAQLSISTTKLFVSGMVAGRGFIAVAVVLLGGRKPMQVFWGALLFGGFDALTNSIQIFTEDFPTQFTYIIPYVATLLALIIYGRQAQRERELAAKKAASTET